jgi:hypothetical protein
MYINVAHEVFVLGGDGMRHGKEGRRGKDGSGSKNQTDVIMPAAPALDSWCYEGPAPA